MVFSHAPQPAPLPLSIGAVGVADWTTGLIHGNHLFAADRRFDLLHRLGQGLAEPKGQRRRVATRPGMALLLLQLISQCSHGWRYRLPVALGNAGGWGKPLGPSLPERRALFWALSRARLIAELSPTPLNRYVSSWQIALILHDRSDLILNNCQQAALQSYFLLMISRRLALRVLFITSRISL